MALTGAQQDDATRQLVQRLFVQGNVTANFAHDELLTNVAAIDAFLDANAAALNNQFTANFKANATAAQKALLVAWCCLKRAGAI